MFSKPQHGWTQFKIGDYEQNVSNYITNVPGAFLDGFINLYQTGESQAIELDSEGLESIVLLNFWMI